MVASAENAKQTVDRSTRLAAALFADGRVEASVAVLAAAVRVADEALGSAVRDPCPASLPDEAGAPLNVAAVTAADAEVVRLLRGRALVSVAEARLMLLLLPPPSTTNDPPPHVAPGFGPPPASASGSLPSSLLAPPSVPSSGTPQLQARLASELWGPPAVAALRVVAAALLEGPEEGAAVGREGEALSAVAAAVGSGGGGPAGSSSSSSSELLGRLEMRPDTREDWMRPRDGPLLPLLLRLQGGNASAPASASAAGSSCVGGSARGFETPSRRPAPGGGAMGGGSTPDPASPLTPGGERLTGGGSGALGTQGDPSLQPRHALFRGCRLPSEAAVAAVLAAVQVRERVRGQRRS